MAEENVETTVDLESMKETEHPEAAVSYPVDDACFLCVGLPDSTPPEEKKMTVKEFHFAYGFALGVVTSLRGAGPYYCPYHHAIVRRALLSQGVNWGAPDRRRSQ